MKNYRSTLVGFAVLIVLLSAGAAQSLSGTNTVTSDDIVNESLIGADIKNESLTSAEIANESLRAADILNGSLGSAEVRNNSITGADVNESTLVPNCPADHELSGDICFGPLQNAGWLDAFAGCAAIGDRLPSPPEAALVTRAVDVSTPPKIWTDEVDATNLRAAVANHEAVTDVDFAPGDPNSPSKPYYCVTSAR